MKKRSVLSIFFCAIAVISFAQQKQGRVWRSSQRDFGKTTVIGQAQLEVQYALNATDMLDSESYIDLHVLQVGGNISKHYSWFLQQSDSLREDFIKKNPNAGGIPHFPLGREGSWWSEYQFTEIFTEGGQQTLYAQMPKGMERYNGFYSEKMGQQQWELHTDTLTVLGHKCQRATCHWRGRDFVAWFTPDIPVRLGPWTFNGLPGLILKVYDTDNLYTYEAVSLRSGVFPISKREYKSFSRGSRERIYPLQVAANRNFMKASGATSRPSGQPISREFPYEPLEKE